MERRAADQQSAEALYELLATMLRRAPRDMSLTSLSTLSTLDRTGPRRITDLASVEGVAQPSMTNLVSNLERDGLVDRRSDSDDRRVALVAITERGLAYLRARRSAGADSLTDLMDKLTNRDSLALAAATAALVRLRHLDDEQRDPNGLTSSNR